jgi:hypothetical protein
VVALEGKSSYRKEHPRDWRQNQKQEAKLDDGVRPPGESATNHEAGFHEIDRFSAEGVVMGKVASSLREIQNSAKQHNGSGKQNAATE